MGYEAFVIKKITSRVYCILLENIIILIRSGLRIRSDDSRFCLYSYSPERCLSSAYSDEIWSRPYSVKFLLDMTSLYIICLYIKKIFTARTGLIFVLFPKNGGFCSALFIYLRIHFTISRIRHIVNFLNNVHFAWIQSLLSPRLVAIPKLENSFYLNISPIGSKEMD